MKKILILALTLTIILSTLGTLPAMAAPTEKGVFYQDKAIARATNTIKLDKKTLILQKGKSSTLKATLNPVKPGGTVTWESSNPKIAKVSSSGKVTAVAPGTVWIVAKVKNYNGIKDGTGDSSECFVTVEGSSKDPKPLDASDQTFYYGSKKLAVPAWTKNIDYYYPLMNMTDTINSDCDIGEGPNNGVYYVIAEYFASSSVHTEIYYAMNTKTKVQYGFGYNAYTAKSPIKTNRGIKVGGTKSDVTKAYGLPSFISSYKNKGVDYEVYVYQTYSLKSDNALYMNLAFVFQKSKTSVLNINYYYGLGY